MENGASSYRRFLADENDGLSDLIHEYNDDLVFYINSFVNNICVAEELTEEVFVELVVKKPRYSGKSSFKTWLFSIAKHITADYIKAQGKCSYTPVDEMYQLSDEENLEKRFFKEDDKILLYKCLGKLCSDYKQVIYLSYFEELSNTETASLMKKTNRQIENLLYRAKKALRKELEKEGYVYEEF